MEDRTSLLFALPGYRFRKRRFVCAEARCPRRSFTLASAQLPARSRVTTRLRERVGAAVAGANRAVSEVAAECGIAWWTAHRILVLAAAAVACPPAPTAMIGIDETREGHDCTGPWQRSDPWTTSIVDLDPGRPGGSSGSPSVAPVSAWRTGSRCRATTSGTLPVSWRSTQARPKRRGSGGHCPVPGS